MKVVWSSIAELTFVEILENIQNQFSNREAKTFYEETFHIISLIDEMPQMFKQYKNQNVRRALIHKITSLFYEVDTENNEILLLAFFDNRMSEKRIESLLNQ